MPPRSLAAAGSIRDQYLKKLKHTRGDFTLKQEEARSYEDNAGLTDLPCYYKSRPRRGNPYVCRFEKSRSEGYSRSKRFYSCENWKLFTLEEGQESHSSFSKYDEISSKCESLQAEMDEVNTVIQARKMTRLSAENVVLDLLLETEKVGDLVFAAKAATQGKPDSIGEESSLCLFRR